MGDRRSASMGPLKFVPSSYSNKRDRLKRLRLRRPEGFGRRVQANRLPVWDHYGQDEAFPVSHGQAREEQDFEASSLGASVPHAGSRGHRSLHFPYTGCDLLLPGGPPGGSRCQERQPARISWAPWREPLSADSRRLGGPHSRHGNPRGGPWSSSPEPWVSCKDIGSSLLPVRTH